MAAADHLSIGSTELKPWPVVLGSNGILGCTFLHFTSAVIICRPGALLITIDHAPAKNIGDILKRKGYSEIELFKPGEDKYSDTYRLKGALLFAPVSFEGINGLFLVDTGFLYTTINSLKVKKDMWWRSHYFPRYWLKDALGQRPGCGRHMSGQF